MFKKTKQQIRELQKENDNLKIALEGAKMHNSVMQEEIMNLNRGASEESVAQQLRNAIARQCEKVGNNTMYSVGVSALDIWALVMAYNCFVEAVEKRMEHD